MSFDSLGLSEALLKSISQKGYTDPSPIQEKAIPPILEGRDVLASAQTGTGKTAGFALPMLQILEKSKPQGKRRIRALILTPTRELAAQVLEEIQCYSEYVDIKSTVIFGGVGARPQIARLRQGVDILVATPGRLLDLHSQRALSLSEVDILVLDEADRMLDMGFQRDIQKILKLIPERRQNLLFSATFSFQIKKLAKEFMFKPILVEATPENTTVEKINQKVYRVDKGRKPALTIKLISEGDWQQVLVFTRTKHGANRLAQKLTKAGINSAAIHGNKSQGARTKALADFKANSVRVLVATDIAARGLDIHLLPHVVNFELPNVAEDYVHRIGRTGRAGASGEAVSLVSGDEIAYLRGIEKLVDMKIPSEIIEGFEPLEGESKPPKQGQGPRNHSNSRNGNSRGKGNQNWRRKKSSSNSSSNSQRGRR